MVRERGERTWENNDEGNKDREAYPVKGMEERTRKKEGNM